MYYKNAEAVIIQLANKGFLKYRSAKKIKAAQETLENLRLEYMEDE